MDEHCLYGDHRRGTVFHACVVGNFQLPDHLNYPISGLGFRGRKAGQNSPCGVFGIEGVGLPDQSPNPAVGPINFPNAVPVASDERGQPGAV
jgi:hypothetical protein